MNLAFKFNMDSPEDEVPPPKRDSLLTVLFAHALQSFWEIVLNMFFSRMEILGSDNFPKFGPAIIVGNHNNQFADGVVLSNKVYEMGRDVRFIIAEKSWHRPIIGHLAKAIKCIPVARPQDSAKRGPGTVSGTSGESVMRGVGTTFATSFGAGDKIKAGAKEFAVDYAESDTELRVKGVLSESLASVPYKIMKKVDQDVVYRRVYDLFLDGGLLGIFPEGGSHDRTEMLELKPGVCIMALGAMHMHPELEVKIVPCGLNYIAGHKFRSKVVLQFGPPIEISRELVQQYATDKRGAISTLLEQIRRSLKDVVVEAPDYDALTTIHSLRRLYTPLGRRLNPKEYHILNKRLSTIYYDYPNIAGFDELQAAIRAYRTRVDNYGLSDAQVARMQLAVLRGRKRNAALLLVKRVLTIIGSGIICLPGMALAYPITFVGERVAAQKAKEALAGSDVKIQALDVMASWKLIILMIMVPLLILVYTSIAFCVLCVATELPWTMVVVLTAMVAIGLPAYGNASLKLFDDMMRGVRTLRPLYLRATGTFHKGSEELIVERARLQKEVRAMIDREGPKLFSSFAMIRLIKPEEFEKEAALLERVRKASLVVSD